MKQSLTSFLGDTPLRVIVKLAIYSVIVGVVMSALGWTPKSIYQGIVRFFERIWELGFGALYNSFEYLFIGAAIVVPIFVLSRILNMRKPPR